MLPIKHISIIAVLTMNTITPAAVTSSGIGHEHHSRWMTPSPSHVRVMRITSPHSLLLKVRLSDTMSHMRPMLKTATHAVVHVVHSLVSPLVMRQWRNVAFCETHLRWNYEWNLTGSSNKTGGLGIMNSSWDAYGGQRFAPRAGLATPEQQVYIATIIQRGYPVPDQPVCTGSW